jgi:hypothetical protein
MRRENEVAYLVILFVAVTRSALMRCSFIVKPKDRVSIGNGSDNFDAIALIELIPKLFEIRYKICFTDGSINV